MLAGQTTLGPAQYQALAWTPVACRGLRDFPFPAEKQPCLAIHQLKATCWKPLVPQGVRITLASVSGSLAAHKSHTHLPTLPRVQREVTTGQSGPLTSTQAWPSTGKWRQDPW